MGTDRPRGDDAAGPADTDAGRGVDESAAGSEGPAPIAVYVRDVLGSIGAVVLVGALLFTVSGVYPPLVAIESPSMTPNIETGDMVFVMDEERFPGPEAHHGVVTARVGATVGYSTFGEPGDVIIFEPNGDTERTPVIHRAMFWVEGGENWYDRADDDAVGVAENCDELRNCPAPHSGFVTKGDFNSGYDQAGQTSTVVRPAWVIGTAEVRVPGLGWIRLQGVAGDGGDGPTPAGRNSTTLIGAL
jgi:signal peptidase